MSTKAQRQKIVAEKVADEKSKILKTMRDADIYSRTVDSLLESYLDTFEIYQTMYLQWKEKGFPATQRHTNKAGATNVSKHPLAQLVETWSDKKVKQLDLLGLSNRNVKSQNIVTGGSRVNHNDVLTKPKEKIDELAEHRKKWRDNG